MSQPNDMNSADTPPRWWRWLRFGVLFCSLTFAGVIVHEIGHAVSAEWVGGEFVALYITPGVELFPDFGAAFPHEWQEWVAITAFNPGPAWRAYDFGFVGLMGCGFTMTVALIANVLLWWLRPKFWLVRDTLVIVSFYFLDMLTYTIIPSLGFRHWVVIGGSTAEPLVGARQMDIPDLMYFTLLFATCAGLCVSLWRYARRYIWQRELAHESETPPSVTDPVGEST